MTGYNNTAYSYSAMGLELSHFSPPGLTFFLYKIQMGSDTELCYVNVI